MKIIKIGRSSGNDVVINDGQVSRTHCQIIKDDNGNYRLIDTNSANGTYVNGVQRHGEVRLNQSDIVRIGNTVLPWQTYFNNAGRTETGGSTIVDNGGYQPSAPSQNKPDNFLVWAILGTVFCCLPFGIASIVNASKVDSRWYAGDYAGAEKAARQARIWFWWAFATGLVATVIYLVFYIVVGVGEML
ncbi:MAG: CD225/dispanin family protein [Prevotella sp.]|jgi:predicted secreted protein|nr:CD225/dispanin family protein [Prevotella sp.]